MKVFSPQQAESKAGGDLRVALGVFLLVVAGAGAGGAGFWYGQTGAEIQATSGQTVSMLESMFERERLDLEAARRETLSHLDALGASLGRMQAEVLRLNALGGRLVQMADLDAEEFDFENPPALGGPDPDESDHSSIFDLADEMSKLAREIQDRDRKLSLLENLIMESELGDEILPTGRPVRSAHITSRFGYRKDPLHGRHGFHRGVDFAGKRGTEIIAVADGLVVLSESRSGYGRTVEIRHGNGLMTRYAHNQKLLVKEGDLVKQGQAIATLGSSGRATGPHLHFEVLKEGSQVNPMKYIGLARKPWKDRG